MRWAAGPSPKMVKPVTFAVAPARVSAWPAGVAAMSLPISCTPMRR